MVGLGLVGGRVSRMEEGLAGWGTGQPDDDGTQRYRDVGGMMGRRAKRPGKGWQDVGGI